MFILCNEEKYTTLLNYKISAGLLENTYIEQKNKKLNILKESIKFSISICKNFLKYTYIKVRPKIAFNKLMADLNYKLHEYDKNNKYLVKATDFYDKTFELINTGETNGIKVNDSLVLTFIINYTIFLGVKLNKRDKAIEISKDFLNKISLKGFDNIEKSNKNLNFLSQIIKDNLSLWSKDELFKEKMMGGNLIKKRGDKASKDVTETSNSNNYISHLSKLNQNNIKLNAKERKIQELKNKFQNNNSNNNAENGDIKASNKQENSFESKERDFNNSNYFSLNKNYKENKSKDLSENNESYSDRDNVDKADSKTISIGLNNNNVKQSKDNKKSKEEENNNSKNITKSDEIKDKSDEEIVKLNKDRNLRFNESDIISMSSFKENSNINNNISNFSSNNVVIHDNYRNFSNKNTLNLISDSKNSILKSIKKLDISEIKSKLSNESKEMKSNSNVGLIKKIEFLNLKK